MHNLTRRTGHNTYHIFQLGFDFFGCEFFADRRFPEQHITVVRQQLRTFGLRLRLCTDTRRQRYLLQALIFIAMNGLSM